MSAKRHVTVLQGLPNVRNRFYERAVALDRAAHQDTKIQIQPDHYAFARDTNALPIAASEFADAGRHYPIVFVGDEHNNFHVAVLLGLEDRSNLFVTPDGMWQADTYVPASRAAIPSCWAPRPRPNAWRCASTSPIPASTAPRAWRCSRTARKPAT